MQCVFSRRLHGETQAPWNLSQYTEGQAHHPKNIQHDPQPAGEAAEESKVPGFTF